MASLVLERVGCMGLVYLLLTSSVVLSSCFGRGGEETDPFQPNNDFTPLQNFPASLFSCTLTSLSPLHCASVIVLLIMLCVFDHLLCSFQNLFLF